ncbi:unnamed protein product, partial [Cyprideis torosa]
MDLRFGGVAGVAGVAIGTATVISPPADLGSVPDKAAKDIEKEIASFQEALKLVRRDIKVVGRSLAQRLRSEEQALFDVYLRMLDDNALAGEVVSRIEQGNWAQGALREVVSEHVHQFSMMGDPYLRERATDIKDLGRRVLAYLQEAAPASLEFTDETILVADELTPAMLGEVPSEKLVGLVSVHGSSNSHVAILARSMGIPTIMGAVDLPLTRIDGRELILDGYSGRIYVQPSKKLLTAYSDIVRCEQEQATELEALKDLPAETTDGFVMPLWEQADTYRKQIEAFSPRPVTMRTLDIGGDKALPYFPINEENPFLGWRGIRVTLDHPEIFLVQVRAMLKAGEGYDNLRIMLPMVTSVGEVEDASRQIDRAVRELQDEGYAIKRPLVGVMVEVPAAVY